MNFTNNGELLCPLITHQYMKKKIGNFLICIILVSSGIIFIPNAFAENVPEWVKNTAGWWATDAISETEFVNAVEFLVKEDIIQVHVSQTSETSKNVPEWVKNTAGWWATNAISETEFVNAIAYLIKVGIINIESSKSPELIANMWVNGDINDDKFLANVEQLIQKDIITIKSDSITKTSQLPDWLVNNAGWWAARIITNSDFNFDPGYVKEEIYPCAERIYVSCFTKTYNSYGFRGSEFQEQKSGTDFRIFIVGGSTTFGTGVDDDDTWPVHLQKIANEKITEKDIEVINFGISAGTSKSEYDLIKNKIVSLDPDLIIMYDGWNDFRQISAEETIQNWKSVCRLGENEGFDAIIIIQPLPITGFRVPTGQEMTNSFSSFSYVQKSQQYVDVFKELDKSCSATADFRHIFDYTQEPIFYDDGHTLGSGNKIIAENVFSVISPIYFNKTYSITHNQSMNNEPDTVYAVAANLSGRNFDDLSLQNAVFDKADLSDTSFKNTNIDGARFAFANLNNSNLLDRTDLHNVNLAGTDLSNVSLKGKDLSGANLSFVDLSEHDLTGTNLIAADLSHTKISNVSLKGKDLSGANLSFVDLSEHDLTGTNFSDSILLNTNLSGMDLRYIPFTNADFRSAILSESKLSDALLVNNNFDVAKLNNINFAGKDLSKSSFQQTQLEGSDMRNTNLDGAKFIQVDFTKIKNKSLAGANLSYASFAHSNLSGVSLDNVILQKTNFWKADLSGLDFTVVSFGGLDTYLAKFLESNLSNANFEGKDLFTDEVFSIVLKNKAYLNILSPTEIRNDVFGVDSQVLVISNEVNGSDLTIKYLFYTNFKNANLENTNFKNADLKFANFNSANLANADLSGADLRKAFLSNANLSNANLDGVNLEGATLGNAILTNANLKCVNHPICESD